MEFGEYLKKPIILDSRHRITELFIRTIIKKAHQPNRDNKRGRYRIICMRNAVRKVVRNCQRCKNKKYKLLIPFLESVTFMLFRTVSTTFYEDRDWLFWTYYCLRYRVIFTYTVTKAIYVEIAQDLTTSTERNSM